MIERFGSGGPWEATVGYSRTVRAGDHVHVSGCTATHPDGRILGGDSPFEQAKAALANLLDALALAGASAGDVVRTRMFVTAAAPGAGKTRPALEYVRRMLAAKAITSVVIVAPTAPLTRQWATAAAKLGLNLVPDADSPKPTRDFHGVSVTYARVAMGPE